MTMRSLLFHLHRLAGLFAGVFLLVSGATGSLLVFGPELDRWLNGALLETIPQQQRAPLQTALDRAHHAFPDDRPFRVSLPRDSQGVYEVALAVDGGAPWTNDRLVYVDPYSGEIIGSRMRRETLRGFLWYLHTEWLLGDIGATAVGVLGLFLLGLSLSGLILWQLRRKRLFKHATWNASKLHRTVGICSLAVALPIAITGSSLVFSNVARSIINTLTASPVQPHPLHSVVKRGVPPPSLDQLLITAGDALSGGEAVWIDLPATPHGVYKVRKKMADEVNSLNGMSYFYHDQYSGELLWVDAVSNASLSVRIQRLLFPIHTGAIGGVALRAVYVVAGLMLTLLFVTGCRQWWRRR